MFNYKFSNLLGNAYKGGNLEFSSDGNSLLSAADNRVQLLDLVQNRVLCLEPENRKSNQIIALSPDNKLLITIDEEGHSLILNFAKSCILERLNFKCKVRDAKWSPDSKWLGVTKGCHLELWKTPTLETGWKAQKYRTLGGHRDDIFKITWSEDSKYILTSGEDMQVRLYSVEDGVSIEASSSNKSNSSKDTSEKTTGSDTKKDDSDDGGDDEKDSDDDEKDSDNEESEEAPQPKKRVNRLVPSASGTEKEKMGNLGKLSGAKARRTFGGFKPMIFAELRQPVRGSYFSTDKSMVFCICKDGVVATWRFQTTGEENKKTKKSIEGDEEFEWNAHEKPAEGDDILVKKGHWNCASKTFMHLPGGNKVTDTAFNPKTNIALVGLTGGIFTMYELLPKVSAVHTLSIGQSPIDRVAISPSGEWVSAGSSATGQLLVWEWQSETYIVKQQGHHWGIQCCAFSPSGIQNMGGKSSMSSAEGQSHAAGYNHSIMATGGYDGKVKLWNTLSGFNFVTFSEHTAEVKDICFTPQANAILTASADGSVRAFDLLRYRNFRTFVSPPNMKKIFGFEAVTTDGGGEIVAAAAKGETYNVLLWSIQTGKLLEVISGNEGPVSCLKFSPNPSRPGELVTGSWDGFLTVSDIFKRNRGSQPEKLGCSGSVLSLAFDPRGNNTVACSTLAGQIQFWDIENAQVHGEVEGIRDILSGRDAKAAVAATNTRGKKGNKKDKYKFSIEYVNLNQHFSSIAYNTSGALLLASSRNSPHVCMYSTTEYNLVYRFTMTNNQSLSGLKVLLNNSKTMVDGNVWAEFELSDSEEEDYQKKRRRIDDAGALPGVTTGESAKSYDRNQFHCWNCDFSTDGKSFSVATSHGLYLYNVDHMMGSGNSAASSTTHSYGTALERFQPTILSKNVSVPLIMKALNEERDVTKAFILSLALNDASILLTLYEKIPVQAIPDIVQSIGAALLPTLIRFLACVMHPTWGSRSIQRHVAWIECLLDTHMQLLLQWTSSSGATGADRQRGKENNVSDPILMSAKIDAGEVQASLLQLLQQCTQQHVKLSKVFDSNTHALIYLDTCKKKVAIEDECS